MHTHFCFHLIIAFILLAQGTLGYTTAGNLIVDPYGQPILLKGVSRPGFEWSVVGDSNPSLQDYTNMKSWGCNVIRLPMNQAFWLSTSTGPGYQSIIRQQVDWIKSLGMGVILDLHWSQMGNPANAAAQQLMADDLSITFWTQVASAYKNDPWVMFELYNEPHDVPWQVWLSGGDTGAGWNAVGMQTMHDAVRGIGAENLVIICGLNWGFDLSGLPAMALVGHNIAYSTHVYDFPGKQIADWPAGFGFAASTYPLLATEFGEYACTPTFISDFIGYTARLNASWVAWAWYVGGCAFPSLITDWSGTPSIDGVIVKQALVQTRQVPYNGLPSSIPITTRTTTRGPTISTTPASIIATTPATSTATLQVTPRPVSPTAFSGPAIRVGAGSTTYWLSLVVSTCPSGSTIAVQTPSSFPNWLPCTYQDWGAFTIQANAPLFLPISIKLTYPNGTVLLYDRALNSLTPGTLVTTGPAPTPTTTRTQPFVIVDGNVSSTPQATYAHTPSPTTMRLPAIPIVTVSGTPDAITIIQHPGSNPWWFAIAVNNSCIRSISLSDSSALSNRPMQNSNWGYFIWSSVGSPLQPPLRITMWTVANQSLVCNLNISGAPVIITSRWSICV